MPFKYLLKSWMTKSFQLIKLSFGNLPQNYWMHPSISTKREYKILGLIQI